MSEHITVRFINGLKNYNLTQEEIKDWKYIGGRCGSHRKYWLRTGRDIKDFPPLKSKCVCGHDILQNCYISPKDSNGFILTLGSCCIKRFLEKPYATCEICELKHRNTKDNICKDCRMKCIKCNIIRTNKHDSGLCKNCLRKCNGCRKMIYKKLDKCIGCKYNS